MGGVLVAMVLLLISMAVRKLALFKGTGRADRSFDKLVEEVELPTMSPNL